MLNTVVEFKNISLSFGDHVVLEDINFELGREEKTAIVGQSGSGKSTIANLIAGLLQPSSGQVVLNTKLIGFAFQRGCLFMNYTVKENLELVLEQCRSNIGAIDTEALIDEFIGLVSLDNAAELYPEELSGGMQKRLGIARALVINPDLVILDEPSGGLDPMLASKLEHDLMEMLNKTKTTSIIITHKLDTIDHLAERVLMINDRQIVFHDIKERFLNGVDPYSRQFCNKKVEGPIEI